VEAGALQRSSYISLLFKVLPFPLSYSPTFVYLFNAIAPSPTPAIRLVAGFNRTRGSSSSSSSNAHLPPSSPKPWHQSVAYGHPTSFTVNLPRVAVFVAGVLLDPDTRPLIPPESRISMSRRSPSHVLRINFICKRPR
jgi:hypothetical protein